MSDIKLIVPGLLGPFSSAVPDHIQHELKQPVFDVLNKILSRAQVSTTQADNYFTTLVSEISPQCDSSACQLSAIIDGIDISDGYFYRADPVHFKAESDHAILIGSELVCPDIDESRLLIEAFNRHFKEDNLSLHMTHKDRWYLKCERSLELEFSALDYSLGRDIKHFMPKGKDELWWRKIVNEAQMLFFQNEVNQLREDSRKLSINGLWLWDMPSISFKEEHRVEPLIVFTDDVIAKALVKQRGSENKPLNEFADKPELLETNLLITDQLYTAVCYGDIGAWLESLEKFCQTTLTSVFELLNSKNIDNVYIYPCDGRVFKINRGLLIKFWKSTKTVDKFLPVTD